MYLTCCHRRLPIHVGDNVVDDNNDPAHGLFMPATMRIVIDRQCPVNQRRETLVHELAHAFDYVAGEVNPNNDEALKHRIAMIEAQFNLDLDAQGGERAIHAMFGDEENPIDNPLPGEYVTVADDSAAEWPTDIGCPVCHHRHTSGRVQNGRPQFNARLNCFELWRVMTCVSCDRQFRWMQRCNEDGLPVPHVIVPPMLRRLQPAE